MRHTRGSYTKASIRRLLNGPNQTRAVKRGIVRLFSFQTGDEQHTTKTRYMNRRGFSVATVKRGSEIARKVLRGGYISYDEFTDAYNICRHHAGQLAEYANSRNSYRRAA